MASSALFLLVVSLSAGAVLALPADNKIFGGRIVNISSVPWQVAITYDGKQFCGGTIISPHWIMTAAHCTHENYTAHLGLRVGSDYYASGGQTLQIEEVVNHEEYEGKHHDISLIKVNPALEFSDKVAPADLPEQDEPLPALGTKLTVSGWGRRDNFDLNSTEELYAVNVELVEFAKCEKLYQDEQPDENIQVCAGSFGRDSCSGDSGGPLVYGKRVLGVVSYGVLLCGNFPGIYTRVSGYRDWIKEKTGL